MKKIWIFTFILSLVLLFSACAAESPAVSEPESAAPAVLYPLENQTQDFSNSMFSASFDAADLVKTENGYTLDVEIFAYDIYDAVEVQMLETYASIVVCGEEIPMDAISVTDAGTVEINGGLGEGICLMPNGGGTYRTVAYNDYPLYYSVGTQSFEISEDVRVTDLSHYDETATVTDEALYPEEAVFGYAELESAITDNTLWNPSATSVRTEDGKIVSITRIWTP
ncbi:MAG: hypothetical protein IIY04_04230 [Oscillospiraceae bacterium]|nr:hypothetical protein [Oscillospiraceae bacterium]